MRNFWAVYTRELKSYFASPIFYILATVFIVVVGNNFKDSFFEFASRTMTLMRTMANRGGYMPLISVDMVAARMFAFMNFVFILIVPLLTMRLYAEEKKNGTMELLMTSPITTTQVLLGKFFSCLSIYSCMMLLTIAFNVVMYVYSQHKLDIPVVLSSYLGTFLLGMALISIGMFFSSLTENQIVAAAVTLTCILGFWLLIYTARYLSPPLSHFMRFLSISDHLDSFTIGFIGVKHVVYYISMTIFWLFMTGITVESARWRQ